MKKISLLFAILMGITTVSGQDSLTLTFSTHTTDGSYLRPDSITIENLTRNWSETLLYPDTTYTFLLHTGVLNHLDNKQLQVTPNPFDGSTKLCIPSTREENALLRLTDIAGRVCAECHCRLQEGGNLFSVSLSLPQTYILNVETPSGKRSAKLTNTGHAGANSIRHEGVTGKSHPEMALKSISTHEFELGDKMRYRCYTPTRVSSTLTKSQFVSEQIDLVFDTHGIPCIDQPTFRDYDGNLYNTVQIGDQCWMKENLRTSHFPDGTEIPVGGSVSLGDTVPYYCDFFEYYNIVIPWEERGNFYNWYAALNVCPNGWHLPSDSEWTVFTDFLSSQPEYVCENAFHNNTYIAKSLSSTSWWNGDDAVGCDTGSEQSTNNATGFSAIPAGFCFGSVSFGQEGEDAHFWTSTDTNDSNALERIIQYDAAYLFRPAFSKNFGRSVRCLRD